MVAFFRNWSDAMLIVPSGPLPFMLCMDPNYWNVDSVTGQLEGKWVKSWAGWLGALTQSRGTIMIALQNCGVHPWCACGVEGRKLSFNLTQGPLAVSPFYFSSTKLCHCWMEPLKSDTGMVFYPDKCRLKRALNTSKRGAPGVISPLERVH